MSIDVAARLLEKDSSSCRRNLALWRLSPPYFAEARDFYAALARDADGPVAVLGVCGDDFSTWFSAVAQSVVTVQAKADDSAPPPVEGYTGGWSDFSIEGGAALIMAPLGAMELLWSERARADVLTCAVRNLREGGFFVFDARCWSGLGRHFIDGAPRLSVEELSPEGVSTMVWETWRPADADKGILELTLGVECLSPVGVVERKFYSNFLLGELDPKEIPPGAVKAGLSVAGRFGDFYGGELTVDSSLQLWVLAKGDRAFSL